MPHHDPHNESLLGPLTKRMAWAVSILGVLVATIDAQLFLVRQFI